MKMIYFIRLLEFLSIIFAFLSITRRNPVYSALWLSGLLLCLGAIFAFLGSPFLGAIQIIVYAGAILVLFLLVIMMMNLRDEELKSPHRTLTKFFSVIGALIIFACFYFLMGKSKAMHRVPVEGTAQSIGLFLLKSHPVLYEVLGVLLIVSAVGAITMAKKKLEV